MHWSSIMIDYLDSNILINLVIGNAFILKEAGFYGFVVGIATKFSCAFYFDFYRFVFIDASDVVCYEKNFKSARRNPSQLHTRSALNALRMQAIVEFERGQINGESYIFYIDLCNVCNGWN